MTPTSSTGWSWSPTPSPSPSTRRVTRRGGPPHRWVVWDGGARGARRRSPSSAPRRVVVVLLPDSGRGYLSKIYNDDWMMDFGFIRCDGPCAGDVLASKDGSIPDLVLVTPDETARTAWGLMRELGVSQVVVSVSKEPPLAAKEVSGTLDELSLMDLAFRDPSVLDRPVAEIMSAADPDDRDRRAGAPDRRAPGSSPARPGARRWPSGRGAEPLGPARLPRGEGARLSGAEPGGSGFETRAIHAGQDADAATGAVIVPIRLATTFAQDAVGKHSGLRVRPDGQPHPGGARVSASRRSKGAARGLAFASGMAAEDAVLRALVGPGDHVVIPDDAYGGTFRLVSQGARSDRRRLERRRALVDGRARAAMTDATKVVWVETPTNPTARRSSTSPQWPTSRTSTARCSSSTTPSQRHTCNGRSSSVPTSSCTRPRSTSVVIRTSSADSSRSPTPTWASASRSSRTRSAGCRARSTATSCCAASRRSASGWTGTARTRRPWPRCSTRTPSVARVLYPGLAAHPGHEVAARQMQGFGGMVSFLAAGGEEAAVELVARDEGVHARGVAGCGRVAHRAPGPDDPRLGGRVAAGRRSGARPPLRRDRDARRPPRRPRPGPVIPSFGILGPR